MSPIILIGIAIFITLILTCLLVPMRLKLILDNRRRSIIISWLMIEVGSNLKEKTFELGLWKRRILRRKFKKAKKEVVEKRTKMKAKEEPKEVEKKKTWFNLGVLWEERDLFLRLTKVALRFLGDILRATRWDKLSLEAEVSTPDPA